MWVNAMLSPFQKEVGPVSEMLHPLVSVAVEALDIANC